MQDESHRWENELEELESQLGQELADQAQLLCQRFPPPQPSQVVRGLSRSWLDRASARTWSNWVPWAVVALLILAAVVNGPPEVSRTDSAAGTTVAVSDAAASGAATACPWPASSSVLEGIADLEPPGFELEI